MPTAAAPTPDRSQAHPPKAEPQQDRRGGQEGQRHDRSGQDVGAGQHRDGVPQRDQQQNQRDEDEQQRAAEQHRERGDGPQVAANLDPGQPEQVGELRAGVAYGSHDQGRRGARVRVRPGPIRSRLVHGHRFNAHRAYNRGGCRAEHPIPSGTEQDRWSCSVPPADARRPAVAGAIGGVPTFVTRSGPFMSLNLPTISKRTPVCLARGSRRIVPKAGNHLSGRGATNARSHRIIARATGNGSAASRGTPNVARGPRQPRSGSPTDPVSALRALRNDRQPNPPGFLRPRSRMEIARGRFGSISRGRSSP